MDARGKDVAVVEEEMDVKPDDGEGDVEGGVEVNAGGVVGE